MHRSFLCAAVLVLTVKSAAASECVFTCTPKGHDCGANGNTCQLPNADPTCCAAVKAWSEEGEQMPSDLICPEDSFQGMQCSSESSKLKTLITQMGANSVHGNKTMANIYSPVKSAAASECVFTCTPKGHDCGPKGNTCQLPNVDPTCCAAVKAWTEEGEQFPSDLVCPEDAFQGMQCASESSKLKTLITQMGADSAHGNKIVANIADPISLTCVGCPASECVFTCTPKGHDCGPNGNTCHLPQAGPNCCAAVKAWSEEGEQFPSDFTCPQHAFQGMQCDAKSSKLKTLITQMGAESAHGNKIMANVPDTITIILVGGIGAMLGSFMVVIFTIVRGRQDVPADYITLDA